MNATFQIVYSLLKWLAEITGFTYNEVNIISLEKSQNDSMSVLDLELPDFSNHPPAPKLSFEQYQRWICEEIVPALARQGKMTDEQLIADFMKNEGSQTEEWPNFGAP